MPRGERCGMPRTRRRSRLRPARRSLRHSDRSRGRRRYRERHDRRRRPSRAIPFCASSRRIPATLTLVAVLLAVGVVFAGLWSPVRGLPAVRDGRLRPARAARRALVDADHGHVLRQPPASCTSSRSRASPAWPTSSSAAARAWRSPTSASASCSRSSAARCCSGSSRCCRGRGRRPRRWRSTSARPGGTMACIAAAAGLLAAPWRVRAWVVLLGFTVVTLFFWGSLADLEHALAVGLVLVRRPVAAHPAHHGARAATHRVRQRPRAARGRGAHLPRSRPTARSVTPTRPTARSSTSRIDVGHHPASSRTACAADRRWAWVLGIILGVVQRADAACSSSRCCSSRVRRIESSVGDVSVAIAQSAIWARAAGLPHLGARRVPRAPQGDDRRRRRAVGRRRQGAAAGARRRARCRG